MLLPLQPVTVISDHTVLYMDVFTVSLNYDLKLPNGKQSSLN